MDSPTTATAKKGGFFGGLFKKKASKDGPADNSEIAQKKAFVQEGRKSLSKVADMVNNREYQYRFEPGHLDLLHQRWSELMGTAPKGKKLDKGIFSPEEFRDKARVLLEDTRAAYQGLAIPVAPTSVAGSSNPHHLGIPHDEPAPPITIQSPSVHREGSGHTHSTHRRATSLRDDAKRRDKGIDRAATMKANGVPADVPRYKLSDGNDFGEARNEHKYATVPRSGDAARGDRDRDRDRRKDDDKYCTDRRREDRDRYKDKYRNGDRDHDRERDKERDKERDRDKYRDRDEYDRDKYRDREKEREREERRRERYKDRDGDRSRDYRDDKYERRRERDRYYDDRDRRKDDRYYDSDRYYDDRYYKDRDKYRDRDRESRDKYRDRDRDRDREKGDTADDHYRDREHRRERRERDKERGDRDRDKERDSDRDRRHRDREDRDRRRDDRDRDRDRDRDYRKEKEERRRAREREAEPGYNGEPHPDAPSGLVGPDGHYPPVMTNPTVIPYPATHGDERHSVLHVRNPSMGAPGGSTHHGVGGGHSNPPSRPRSLNGSIMDSRYPPELMTTLPQGQQEIVEDEEAPLMIPPPSRRPTRQPEPRSRFQEDLSSVFGGRGDAPALRSMRKGKSVAVR